MSRLFLCYTPSPFQGVAWKRGKGWGEGKGLSNNYSNFNNLELFSERKNTISNTLHDLGMI
jgi:hypothetical protein